GVVCGLEQRLEGGASVQAEAEEAAIVERRHGGGDDAWLERARIAFPAEEIRRQIVDGGAARLQHALDRTVETPDAAHAGPVQDRVGLDQQAAEDDQILPIIALGQRREKRRRLARGNWYRQRVFGVQQVDRGARAAQLALVLGVNGNLHASPFRTARRQQRSMRVCSLSFSLSRLPQPPRSSPGPSRLLCYRRSLRPLDHLHMRDAVARQLGDHDLVAGQVDRFAAPRRTTERIEHQAGEGVAALRGHLPAGLAVEVAHLDAAERLVAAPRPPPTPVRGAPRAAAAVRPPRGHRLPRPGGGLPSAGARAPPGLLNPRRGGCPPPPRTPPPPGRRFTAPPLAPAGRRARPGPPLWMPGWGGRGRYQA